jgi:Flp pilus assembly protein TadD
MDPNFNRVRGILVLAYTQAGRFKEAMDQIAHWKGQPETTWAWGWKAYVYGREGRTSDAKRSLATFEALFQKYQNDPTQVLLFAYIGTGQKDRAMNLLEEAYKDHSNVMATLKVDPGYDPLRSDPRFQELVARVFEVN